MEMRPLGATGIEVSALGLGTVKIGRVGGLKYATAGALPSDEDVARLLRGARELGVNLIDTAPAYGVSEARIGEVMRRSGWFGGRDGWVVSTKVGEEFDEASASSSFDFSRAHTRMSVERSLVRLGTECVEVVLVHSDGRDEWIARESGAMEELERLRDEGKVRVIGMSTKSREGGLAAVERVHGAGGMQSGGGAANSASSAAVMVTYNVEAREEGTVIDAAARAGVGVLVKKGLASGRVGDAGEAIRFALRHPGVSSLIVGTTNAGHLETNVRAAMEG